MATQLFRFRQMPNGFRLVVWLDDTKTQEDGSPDPAALKIYDYPPVPQGMTKADYLTQIKRETKLLVQQELASVDQGTSLAGEGQSL